MAKQTNYSYPCKKGKNNQSGFNETTRVRRRGLVVGWFVIMKKKGKKDKDAKSKETSHKPTTNINCPFLCRSHMSRLVPIPH